MIFRTWFGSWGRHAATLEEKKFFEEKRNMQIETLEKEWNKLWVDNKISLEALDKH